MPTWERSSDSKNLGKTLRRIRLIAGTLVFALSHLPGAVKAQDLATLPTLYVRTQQTANVLPVSTYGTPISNLEFEPRVDLQSRNMAEAQGDVSIRGGIFENTGFRVGSATLMDPQTGHYFAEIPIAPEMLERPDILTGVDNGLYGFNSMVGTINYGWSQIATGGSLTAGGGDHSLNFQRIHGAWSPLSTPGEWSWGTEAEASRSESDGTIRYGDHDFNRYSGRVQLVGPNSQTDLFAGYQSKFFGWPELYAAPFGFNETENLKTRLFLFNNRQNYGSTSFWEVTSYYRRHNDQYVLSRENPSIYEASHETDVYAFALSGQHSFGNSAGLDYAMQVTLDEIDSTALENNFTSRSYYKLSLLPGYRFGLRDRQILTVRSGVSFDTTNRDDSAVSPLLDVTWRRTRQNGTSESLYLSYSGSSQVAGYTAVGGSETGGLFRSNHSLGRETSQNFELGGTFLQREWSAEGAIFYRRDDNLVDWTFSKESSSARSANNVDIEAFGIELIATRRLGDLEAIISYSYLSKHEDYRGASIDTSFYALNYPGHRTTFGTIWRPIDIVEIRIDNESRRQEANFLRAGNDEAFYTHLAVSVFPPQLADLEVHFAVDNLWDDSFQDVPGTPGRGDQYSAGLTWRW